MPRLLAFVRKTAQEDHMALSVRESANTAATWANNAMRHVDLYRVAEHFYCKHQGIGSAAHFANDVYIKCLGDFSQHDLDADVTPIIRKVRLSRISLPTAQKLAKFINKTAESNSNNPVILHQMRRISDALVGANKSPQEVRAYIRRSSRQIHPDRCEDLKGWTIHGENYRARRLPGWDYEHALHGALGLFLLHRSIDNLWAQPYWSTALNGVAAKKGGEANPFVFLAQYALLSAGIGYLWLEGAAWALAVLVTAARPHCISFFVERRRRKLRSSCRALVPYNPKVILPHNREGY